MLFSGHNQLSLDIHEDYSIRNYASPSKYVRIFVSALNTGSIAAMALQDCRLDEVLLCQGQDGCEDQEISFFPRVHYCAVKGIGSQTSSRNITPAL